MLVYILLTYFIAPAQFLRILKLQGLLSHISMLSRAGARHNGTGYAVPVPTYLGETALQARALLYSCNLLLA